MWCTAGGLVMTRPNISARWISAPTGYAGCWTTDGDGESTKTCISAAAIGLIVLYASHAAASATTVLAARMPMNRNRARDWSFALSMKDERTNASPLTNARATPDFCLPSRRGLTVTRDFAD